MNGDLISRSELLKKIRAYADSKVTNEGVETANSILKTVQVIEKMPTVDAEPVWNGQVKCYFCGRGKPIKAYTYLHDCGLQYGTTIEAVYCPNCGSKMDLEE